MGVMLLQFVVARAVRYEYVRHCAPLHRNWGHTKAQALGSLQLLDYPVHMYAGVSMTPTCRPPIDMDN